MQSIFGRLVAIFYAMRAWRKYLRGDYEAALAGYARAIELNPRSSAYWAMHGHCYGALQNPDMALQDAEKALALNPKNPTAYLVKHLYYNYHGDYINAIKVCTEALSLQRDAAYANNRANARLESGDWVGAVADYNYSLSLLKPGLKYPTLYSNRALAYARSGSYQLALNDSKQALELLPVGTHPTERLILNLHAAEINARAGKTDIAHEYLNWCSDYLPKQEVLNRPAWQGLLACYKGHVAALQLQDALAIEIYTQAIKYDPTLRDSYLERAELFQKRGDHTQAIEDCSAVLRLAPQCMQAYEIRAKSYRVMEQADAAAQDERQYQTLKAEYDLTIRSLPPLPKLKRFLGMALPGQQTGSFRTILIWVIIGLAILVIVLNLRGSPTQRPPQTSYQLGLRNYRSGNYSQAVEQFSTAISANQNIQEAYYYRGRAQFEQDKFAEALANFDQALRLEPNYAYAYYWRGLTRHRLKDTRAAAADFKKALQYDLDPDDADYARDYVDRYGTREG